MKTDLVGKGIVFTMDRHNTAKWYTGHYGVILGRFQNPGGPLGFLVRTWIWMNTTEIPVYPDEIMGIEE